MNFLIIHIEIFFKHFLKFLESNNYVAIQHLAILIKVIVAVIFRLKIKFCYKINF